MAMEYAHSLEIVLVAAMVFCAIVALGNALLATALVILDRRHRPAWLIVVALDLTVALGAAAITKHPDLTAIDTVIVVSATFTVGYGAYRLASSLDDDNAGSRPG